MKAPKKRAGARAAVAILATLLTVALAAPLACGQWAAHDLRALTARFSAAGDRVSSTRGYLRSEARIVDDTGALVARVVLHHGPVFLTVAAAQGHRSPRVGRALVDVHAGDSGALVLRQRVPFLGRGRGTVRVPLPGGELTGWVLASHDLRAGRALLEGRSSGLDLLPGGRFRGEVAWNEAQVRAWFASRQANFGPISLVEPRLVRVRTAATGLERERLVLRADAVSGRLSAREPELTVTHVDADAGPLSLTLRARDVSDGAHLALRGTFTLGTDRLSRRAALALATDAGQSVDGLVGVLLARVAGRNQPEAWPPTALRRALVPVLAPGPAFDARAMLEFEDGAELRRIDLALRTGFERGFEVPFSSAAAARALHSELRASLPETLVGRLIAELLQLMTVLGRSHGEPTAEGVVALLDAAVEAGLARRVDEDLRWTASLDGTALEAAIVGGAPLDRTRLEGVQLRLDDLTLVPIEVSLAAVVQGVLGDAVVTARIAEEAPRLRRCARQARQEAGAEVSGQVDASLRIANTGAVTEVQMDSAAPQPDAAEGCFRPLLTSLRFPARDAPSEAFVSIRYGRAIDAPP